MYRTYVLKRAGYGILMFVFMVFVYSTLFNSVADKTVRSTINEQLAQEMRRFKNLDEEQLKNVMAERKLQKYNQYHLNDLSRKTES